MKIQDSTSNIAILRCLNKLLAALKGFFIADGSGLSIEQIEKQHWYLSQNETNVLYLNFQKPKTCMCIVLMDATDFNTCISKSKKILYLHSVKERSYSYTLNIFLLSTSTD